MRRLMKLSEDLRAIFEEEADDEFTIGDLVRRVESKSFGLILILLSLPIALPFTPPGFTVPFGSALALLAAQLIAGRRTPWLPAKVLARRVRGGKSQRMLEAMPRFLSRFERFLRPRWQWVYRRGLMLRLLGVAIFVSAVAMMAPFPITNTVCSVAILLIGLGMLEEDGGFGIAGIVLSVAAALFVVAVALAVFVFGVTGLRRLTGG